ncbi:hypothetical protein ARV3_gp10 [Acidianus rod-shaped virus 3]|uniref:Uncharacterized protein n=1 Tax=Acidianus rod-shaped virus 3 TaxID=2730617 RepID=A0A6M3VZK8_9VIRU|nr:hypothetical protein QIT28_gp10 [Acidianus rod-shaped virus 3]QJF12323.1 hypothetical protein ARV3_gp10 [Acidianus rod-shaped virus 3]
MVVDLKRIQKIIEDQFISYTAPRIDIILFPTDETSGLFYAVYIVEFTDIQYFTSQKIAEGKYMVFPEQNVLIIKIGDSAKIVKL